MEAGAVSHTGRHSDHGLIHKAASTGRAPSMPATAIDVGTADGIQARKQPMDAATPIGKQFTRLPSACAVSYASFGPYRSLVPAAAAITMLPRSHVLLRQMTAICASSSCIQSLDIRNGRKLFGADAAGQDIALCMRHQPPRNARHLFGRLSGAVHHFRHALAKLPVVVDARKPTSSKGQFFDLLLCRASTDTEPSLTPLQKRL